MKEVIYCWEYIFSSRSSCISLLKQNLANTINRHIRNICTFIKLHSKPPTLHNLFWYFLFQIFSNVFRVFQQYLLTKECILISRDIAFCALCQPFFTLAGRTCVSPVGCGFSSFTMKSEISKKTSKNYH